MNLTEPTSVHDTETEAVRFCAQCGEVVEVTIFASRYGAEACCGEGHPSEVDLEELL